MERPKKVTPHVVKMVGTLPRDIKLPKREIRVRVVRYRNQPRQLDIREFIKDGINKVTGGPFTGYTPKGLTLNVAQVKDLMFLLAYVSREELMYGLEEEMDTKRSMDSSTKKSEDAIIDQYEDQISKAGESSRVSTITGTEISDTKEVEKESGNGESASNGSSEDSSNNPSPGTL